MHIQQIKQAELLIMRNLYENGYGKIFKSAYNDGSGTKKINAVVIGMGKHGAEMTRSLAWFCQMDGYLAEINAFDIDPLIAEKFNASCPELMAYSGRLDIEGEAKYTINIHSAIDVDTKAFDEKITALPRATYVFVALGDDEKNIKTAVSLRGIYARMGYNPEIQTVVCKIPENTAVTEVDLIVADKVALGDDIERAAYKRHLKWGDKSIFGQAAYNYKSSVASAIHSEMKKLCGIPGADKAPADRTEQELWGMRILEHCRWNAYMRSEGFVYGSENQKSVKDSHYKTHNCLVPFSKLPLEEQIKDDG